MGPERVVADLFNGSLEHADSVFVRDDKGSLTYRQAWDHAEALALLLLGTGLSKGDRVLLVARNSRWWPIAFLASCSVGLVPALLNYRATDAELVRAWQDVDADAVLSDATVSALAQVCGRSIVFGEDGVRVAGSVQDWPQLLAAAAAPSPTTVVLPEDPGVLLQSSGTTGQPKWVLHRHGAIAGKAAALSFDKCADDRLLLSLPLHSVFGLMSGLMSAAHVGAEVLLTEKFEAERDYRLLVEEQCTHYNSVRSMMLKLMELPEFDARELSLRHGIWGSTLTHQFAATIADRFGVDGFYGGYGATETLGAAMKVTGGQMIALGKTVMGYPLPGYEFKVAAGPGETGELSIRSDLMFERYLGEDPGIDENGWWATGDLVVQEGDCFVFRGRSKEIVRTNSMNISVFEVESALLSHPAVVQAALVGVPDQDVEEVAIAFVVLGPGHDVDEAALLEHCRESLAVYKLPRRVVFRESLPMGVHDKILKLALVDDGLKAWQDHRARN